LTRASPPGRPSQHSPGEELEIVPAESGVRRDPAPAPKAASSVPAAPGHAPVPVWPHWEDVELKCSAGHQCSQACPENKGKGKPETKKDEPRKSPGHVSWPVPPA